MRTERHRSVALKFVDNRIYIPNRHVRLARISHYRNQTQTLNQDSTINAVRHMADGLGKKFASKLWLYILLFGFSSLSLIMLVRLLEYFDYPVATSSLPEHEKFIWPDLTLCYAASPFIVDSVFRRLSGKANSYQLENFLSVLNKKDKKYSNLGSHFLIASSHNDNPIILNSYDQFFKIRSLQLGSVIKDSILKDHKLIDYIHLQYVSLRLNTPCFTISLEKLSNEVTDFSKIVFDLFFNYNSYSEFKPDYDRLSIYAFIHAKNQIPQRPWIQIDPKFDITINLSMQRTVSVTNCRAETDYLDKQKTATIFTYGSNTSEINLTYEDCEMLVIQELYLRNCNCYYFAFPLFHSKKHDLRICSNMAEGGENHQQLLFNLECLYQVYHKYLDVPNNKKRDVLLKKINDRCQHLKTTLCKYLSYKKSVIPTVMLDLWTLDTKLRHLLRGKNTSDKIWRDFDASLIKGYDKYKLNNNTNNNTILGEKETLLRAKALINGIAKLRIVRTLAKGTLVVEDFTYPIKRFISELGAVANFFVGFCLVSGLEVFYYLIYSFKRNMEKWALEREDKLRYQLSNSEEAYELDRRFVKAINSVTKIPANSDDVENQLKRSRNKIK